MGEKRQGRRGGWSGRWGVRAAWIVLLVGLLGSGAAALYRRANARAQDRAAFHATAADIASTVAASLKRDVDFVATLRAIASLEPNLTTQRLDQWKNQIGRFEPQPAWFGTAVIDIIPGRQLNAFARRFEADPVLRTLSGGSFQVVPAGQRPRYCLISAWLSPRTRTATQLPFPLTLDFCAASASTSAPFTVWPILEGEVDTGAVTALAGLTGVSDSESLVLTAPVYRRGTSVTTLAQRRAALQGWVGTGFDVRELVRDAVTARHPNTLVDVYAEIPGQGAQLIVQSGTGRRSLSYTRPVTASSQWTVVVRGDPPSADARALAVFLIGTIVSLLAFLLFRRIGHGRDHALRLLQERDGELLRRAVHDELTGLPTRAFALENASKRLVQARRRGSPMAALLINLDGFRRINNTYGSRVSDELLRAVAQRLSAAIPESDFLARYGGDEFLVLTSRAESGTEPELVAERVLTVLRAPFELPDELPEPVLLTASIGVAFGETSSAQDLQSDAEAALAEAKAAGKNRVVTFDATVRDAVDDRLGLEYELRDAFKAKQFSLLYEPAVDLRTGVIALMEPHVCWNHPTRGRLDASAFMGLAEDAGLAAELDRWIIDEACRQGAAWEREGFGLRIAVNVSARQLERCRLVDDLERAVTVSGITPSRLAIDIPEQALVTAPGAAISLLESIKSLGMTIAVDHFGRGYATPRQLRRLPIDVVKIDPSITRVAGGSRASHALFGTLVELAEEVGAVSAASGIDTSEVLAGVYRDHCAYGQGALISPPLAADEVNAFLAGWPESNPEFLRVCGTPAAALAGPSERGDEPVAALEVILVDDHLAVRKGIELLLRSEGFRIAGLASQVSEARELLARRRYDVALVSVQLGNESALPLVSELLAHDPDTAIVLYTGAASSARIKDAVDVGTRGFLLKSSPPARLVDALRAVAGGGTYVDPELAGVLAEDAEPSKVASLSPREREIFTLLAEGLTGQAIAERLYLSPETVKTHIRNATAKLNAKTRVQAVALVVREAHLG